MSATKKRAAPQPPQSDGHIGADKENHEANGNAGDLVIDETIELTVVLPDQSRENIHIESSLAWFDLLTQLCGKYKLSPTSHKLQPMDENGRSIAFTSSSTVKSTGATAVQLQPKVKDPPKIMPVKNVEATVRLTIKTSKNHQQIMRVKPNDALQGLLDAILARTNKKKEDYVHLELRHPKRINEPLDLTKSLDGNGQIREIFVADKREKLKISKDGSIKKSKKLKKLFRLGGRKKSKSDLPSPTSSSPPPIAAETIATNGNHSTEGETSKKKRPAPVKQSSVPQNESLHGQVPEDEKAENEGEKPTEEVEDSDSDEDGKKKAPAPPKPTAQSAPKSPTRPDKPPRRYQSIEKTKERPAVVQRQMTEEKSVASDEEDNVIHDDAVAAADALAAAEAVAAAVESVKDDVSIKDENAEHSVDEDSIEEDDDVKQDELDVPEVAVTVTKLDEKSDDVISVSEEEAEGKDSLRIDAPAIEPDMKSEVISEKKEIFEEDVPVKEGNAPSSSVESIQETVKAVGTDLSEVVEPTSSINSTSAINEHTINVTEQKLITQEELDAVSLSDISDIEESYVKVDSIEERKNSDDETEFRSLELELAVEKTSSSSFAEDRSPSPLPAVESSSPLLEKRVSSLSSVDDVDPAEPISLRSPDPVVQSLVPQPEEHPSSSFDNAHPADTISPPVLESPSTPPTEERFPPPNLMKDTHPAESTPLPSPPPDVEPSTLPLEERLPSPPQFDEPIPPISQDTAAKDDIPLPDSHLQDENNLFTTPQDYNVYETQQDDMAALEAEVMLKMKQFEMIEEAARTSTSDDAKPPLNEANSTEASSCASAEKAPVVEVPDEKGDEETMEEIERIKEQINLAKQEKARKEAEAEQARKNPYVIVPEKAVTDQPQYGKAKTFKFVPNQKLKKEYEDYEAAPQPVISLSPSGEIKGMTFAKQESEEKKKEKPKNEIENNKSPIEKPLADPPVNEPMKSVPSTSPTSPSAKLMTRGWSKPNNQEPIRSVSAPVSNKPVSSPPPSKPVSTPVFNKPISSPEPTKPVSTPVFNKPTSSPEPTKPVSTPVSNKSNSPSVTTPVTIKPTSTSGSAVLAAILNDSLGKGNNSIDTQKPATAIASSRSGGGYVFSAIPKQQVQSNSSKPRNSIPPVYDATSSKKSSLPTYYRRFLGTDALAAVQKSAEKFKSNVEDNKNVPNGKPHMAPVSVKPVVDTQKSPTKPSVAEKPVSLTVGKPTSPTTTATKNMSSPIAPVMNQVLNPNTKTVLPPPVDKPIDNHSVSNFNEASLPPPPEEFLTPAPLVSSPSESTSETATSPKSANSPLSPSFASAKPFGLSGSGGPKFRPMSAAFKGGKVNKSTS